MKIVAVLREYLFLRVRKQFVLNSQNSNSRENPQGSLPSDLNRFNVFEMGVQGVYYLHNFFSSSSRLHPHLKSLKMMKNAFAFPPLGVTIIFQNTG